MPTVYIAEDDKSLIREATKAFYPNYFVYELDITKSGNVDDWGKLDLTKNDFVVLDLNYSGDPQLKGRISGLDTLNFLLQEKKAGRLGGLVNIIIATSHTGVIDPESLEPLIGCADESLLKIYGLDKVVAGEDKVVVNYGERLKQYVEQIKKGEVQPLNQIVRQGKSANPEP